MRAFNNNCYVTRDFFLCNSRIIDTPKTDKNLKTVQSKKLRKKLQFMKRLENGKLAVGYHHQIGL